MFAAFYWQGGGVLVTASSAGNWWHCSNPSCSQSSVLPAWPGLAPQETPRPGVLQVPPDINSLLMCQVTAALKTKAKKKKQPGGRNHPSLMRSLEQCRVMVLQGRAGYTTASQAEHGNRLANIPSGLQQHGGLALTPGPAAFPQHSCWIPALGKAPCAWSCSCCLCCLCSVALRGLGGEQSLRGKHKWKRPKSKEKRRFPWFASSGGKGCPSEQSLPWPQSPLRSAPHP